MIRIVEGVQQVAMERMNILESWETVDCGGQSLGEGFRGVLDFSGVESSYSADFEASANLRG